MKVFALTYPFVNTGLNILHIKTHFLNSKVRLKKMFLYFLKCIPSYQFLKNIVLPGQDILSDRGHWPEMNSEEIHEEKKLRCFLSIKKGINSFPKRGSKREN